MKIKVIYPSRQRSTIFVKTLRKWTDSAFNKEIEYFISIDSNDPELDSYKAQYTQGERNITLLVNDNTSAVSAINNAARYVESKCERGENYLIVVISDDFNAVPDFWDVYLLREVKGKRDFIVKTKDNLQPTLITLPILDRDYYLRFGYVYNPLYFHMFVDQEMTAVGLMLGKVVKSDITFQHNHYSTGRFKKDSVSVRNDSTWAQGEALFNERLKTNFGIENPVMPYSEIKWR